MSHALTAAQAATLTAIVSYVNENAIPPTRMELADILGVTYTTIVSRLGYLERMGYIEIRANTARGIVVNGTGLPAVGFASAEMIAKQQPKTPHLTRRELQVMALVAEGESNKRIGAKLGISEGTAKFHLVRIMDKLGAKTRVEAAVEAVRLGLMTSTTIKAGA